MFYELMQLALRNLARARARLLMTSGGVLVGTAAVVLLLAMTVGLQNAAETQVGSSASLTEISVYPGFRPDVAPETIPQLTNEAVAAFWQIEGVQVVIPFIAVYSLKMTVDKLETYPQLLGIDPALLPYLNLTTSSGALSLAPGDMLIGGRVGDNFFDPKAQEYRPVVVDLSEQSFRLLLNLPTGGTRRLNYRTAGILNRTDSIYDNSIVMDIREVVRLKEIAENRRIDPETFRYEGIIVRSTSREVTNAVSEAIRALGYQAGGAGDFLNALNNFFGTMRLLLGGVGAIALIVAAFGVANTMTMAILERTREIGLMKAIGATDRHILTVFLIEAGLVGFAGGVAGIGVALLLQSVINGAIANAPQSSGPNFLPIDPAMLKGNLIVIPPELMLLGLTLATVVGLGAGFYPALRAARMVPIVALKTE